MDLARRCSECQGVLVRRADEDAAHFLRRETCSDLCRGRRRGRTRVENGMRRNAAARADMARRRPRGGPDFPHAHVRTFQDLPPRCPRSGCGGPWREVESGVVCRLCSRELIVAEALRRQSFAEKAVALSQALGWR